jgi:hypothetical protein
VQRLRQRIEPRCILSLQSEECGDGGVPLLRSTGGADRPRRAQRRRRAVGGLVLAIASLALGPGQRALACGLLPLPRTSQPCGDGLYSVT